MLEMIIEQEEATQTVLCVLNRNGLTFISSEEIEIMKGYCSPLKLYNFLDELVSLCSALDIGMVFKPEYRNQQKVLW